MSNQICYEISPTTRNPSGLTRESRKAVFASWLCPKCRTFRPKIERIDVQVAVRPRKIPLNLVAGTGIGIIHQDLLEVIGREIVHRDLLIEDVMEPSGNRVPAFSSVRGRTRVLIRGDVTSNYARCTECGRHLYFPKGNKYVLSSALKSAAIWQSHMTGLILNEETGCRVKEHIKTRRWREIFVSQLAVLDAPQDGRPGFGTQEEDCGQ